MPGGNFNRDRVSSQHRSMSTHRGGLSAAGSDSNESSSDSDLSESSSSSCSSRGSSLSLRSSLSPSNSEHSVEDWNSWRIDNTTNSDSDNHSGSGSGHRSNHNSEDSDSDSDRGLGGSNSDSASSVRSDRSGRSIEFNNPVSDSDSNSIRSSNSSPRRDSVSPPGRISDSDSDNDERVRDGNERIDLDGSLGSESDRSYGSAGGSGSPTLIPMLCNESDRSASRSPVTLQLPGSSSELTGHQNDRTHAREDSNGALSFEPSLVGFENKILNKLNSNKSTLNMSSANTNNSSENSAAMPGSNNRIVPFECSVCLEGLDAPASIDGELQINPQENLPGCSTSQQGSGRRRPQSRTTVPSQGTTLTDIVATSCGHLYHQVCLEKWFREQGKRSCPSCRKTVPRTKMIRIYPSLSADTSRDSSASTSLPGVSLVNNPIEVNSLEGNGNGSQECVRSECQDLKDIHTTLINDYSELQERYEDLRENVDLKDAQLRSLEEDNELKTAQITQLKRELDGARSSPASSGGTKRRRH